MRDRLAFLPRALMLFGYDHNRLVLGLAVAVLALGVLVGSQLAVETDVMSLMPRNDPAVRLFRQVLGEFGTLETLLVAVPVGGEDRLDLAFATVDTLGEELAASPNLASVSAHLDDPLKLAEVALRHAVFFLDERGLKQLERQLSDAGLAARAADIRAALEVPHGMLAKELSVRDPLGFLPMLLGQVSRTPATLKVDYSSGYYLSADHSLVVILAKPTGPAQDISFDERLFADLDGRIARAREKVAEEFELKPAEVPEVWLGGGHRIAIEDARLIRSDIITNSVTSVLGVLLLFYLAYRRLAAAHYAFLPLAVGLALTFIFTGLAVGRLNSATAGFAALLVGLGIDFTIVLYGRYLEGRRKGLEMRDAVCETAETAGPAVVMGAVTTVGTFYAFLLTRFTGLREFGLLTGTGIMLMATAAFVLGPALIRVFGGGREPEGATSWLQLARPMRWLVGRRRAVSLVLALVCVASLLALLLLRFDDDVRNLRSPSNQGVLISEKVGRAFGASFNAMMIRIEAPDENAALDKVRRLGVELDGLVASGVISSYESLANLIPPSENQERALRWFESHREIADPARVKAKLSAAFDRVGMVPEAFASGFEILDETLRPTGPVTLDIWRGTPVEQVIAKSLRIEGGRVATVVNVFSPPGKWRREAPPELVRLVEAIPGAEITGVNLVSQRLRQLVRTDAVIAVGAGLVFVVLLLLGRLRSAKAALLCLLPVALAVLVTLGVMAVAGQSLNLLNVFVILMIIGVGSDYGIYMLHRAREQHSVEDLAQTGRAVVLAALTTLVGFGTLVTTHYPGLQSMGWMTMIGVAVSCLGAVFLLPLLTGEK